jgi:hypothetical protein
MAPQATLPRGDVNVPGDYFSLAGFEVIMHGRFWVLTEEQKTSVSDLWQTHLLWLFEGRRYFHLHAHQCGISRAFPQRWNETH